LARLDADTPRPMQGVALRPIAGEILAASAGEAIDRHCDLALADGEASVAGDPVLLQVMLRNLVDNALKHSGGGRIEIAIEQTDDGVSLTVSDDGRGIAPEQHDRVQRRFCRIAGTDSEGSGLGLSIVKRIVELHHGTMELGVPASGQGVTVRVRLPSASG
jgi:signal transduction histidine kinase